MSRKQIQFLESQSKYTAYVGGIRSGKTHAGSLRALHHCQPGSLGLVLGPTFPQLRDSTLRKFLEVAGEWVIDLHKTEMRATMWNGAQILFRSADEPNSTRGIEASWCWMDEAAYMAESMYLIAIGRLSQGGRSGPLWITTTPNGIDNWVYQKFVVEAQDHPDRVLVQSSIRDNPFLSPEFIEAVSSEYVGAFAEQELGGAFVELGGTLFRREWFIDLLDEIPDCNQWVRHWDLATSPDSRADYTVGALLGRTAEGLIVLADIIRGQWEWPEVEEIIVSTAQDDGSSTTIGVESVAYQLSALQTLQRREELLGYTIEGYKPDKGKYQRAMPWASKAKAGVFRVARRSWTPAFIGELMGFTGAQGSKAKDDQVDAVSGGVELIATPGLGIVI